MKNFLYKLRKIKDKFQDFQKEFSENMCKNHVGLLSVCDYYKELGIMYVIFRSTPSIYVPLLNLTLVEIIPDYLHSIIVFNLKFYLLFLLILALFLTIFPVIYMLFKTKQQLKENFIYRSLLSLYFTLRSGFIFFYLMIHILNYFFVV